MKNTINKSICPVTSLCLNSFSGNSNLSHLLTSVFPSNLTSRPLFGFFCFSCLLTFQSVLFFSSSHAPFEKGNLGGGRGCLFSNYIFGLCSLLWEICTLLLHAKICKFIIISWKMTRQFKMSFLSKEAPYQEYHNNKNNESKKMHLGVKSFFFAHRS